LYPTLLSVFGVSLTSYGVSKALAALVAAILLGREFRRRGWDPSLATPLVVSSTIAGFLGAKAYYLAEHAHRLTMHDFGGSGFTWYGGFLAGLAMFLATARRDHLPLLPLAAAAAVPLSVGYGIGRLGCLLAGDGTYGRPTSLPWGVAFPHGTMPTLERVHPTPLYEALAAFAIAALLWAVRNTWRPRQVVAAYLVLSGAARAAVEILRINDKVLLGLTQPQLWSLALVATGAILLVLDTRAGEADSAKRPDETGPAQRPDHLTAADSR
jgi:phosphatidylglycerol:prolipoprotein diacylglycerol transferase